MTKSLQRMLLSTLLTASACGSSTPAKTGTAGTGGGGGSTSAAGATGAAGSTDTAGTTGAAGTAANAGSTGTDAAAGTTGTAGSDAGTNPDVAPTTDGGTTSKKISAATGGTVTAAGFTLDIPAGALAVDTDITVAVGNGAGLPSAASLVASVYDLGPNGTTFTKPVKLTIDVDATKLGAKQPVVSYLAAGAWVSLTDSLSATGGKVTATTTHFTSFGVLGTDAAACVAMTKTNCQACCRATFFKGQNAPLQLAIKSCGCKAGSPCETQCAGAGNVCDANPVAVSPTCKTCLDTVGGATPQSACIVQSQTTDCQADVDCKAYASCTLSCTNTPATDAGTDASTDAAPACAFTFTDTAPAFTITKVATAVPAATGGTIVPGIYWLTDQLDYTGPGGATTVSTGAYTQTYQITATEWNIISTAGGMRVAAASGTATYTATGTTFTYTSNCPKAGAPTSVGYSVVGNTIHFQDLNAAVPSTARVLTRQP
jgi:hypothetical protein